MPHIKMGSAAGGSSPVNPADVNGYLAWSFDAVLSNTNTAPTAGTVYAVKVPITETITVSTVDLYQFAAGATLTNCFIGIYSAAGTQLAATADLSTAWATGGTKASANALSSSVTITGGRGVYVWVMILVGTLVTAPQFGSNNLQTAVGQNVNLAAASSRVGIYATGQSALPSPATMANITTTNAKLWWVGLR